MKISAKKLVSHLKPQVSATSALGALTGSSIAADVLVRGVGSFKNKLFRRQNNPVHVRPETSGPKVRSVYDLDLEQRSEKLSELGSKIGIDMSYLKQVQNPGFWDAGLPGFENVAYAYIKADAVAKGWSQQPSCNAESLGIAVKERENRLTTLVKEFKALSKYFDYGNLAEIQGGLIEQHERECAKLQDLLGADGAGNSRRTASVSPQASSPNVSGTPKKTLGRPITLGSMELPVASDTTSPLVRVDDTDSLDAWCDKFMEELEKA